jgi:hypothetical protein
MYRKNDQRVKLTTAMFANFTVKFAPETSRLSQYAEIRGAMRDIALGVREAPLQRLSAL